MTMIAQKFDVTYDSTKNVVPVFEGVLTPVNLELKFTKRKFT